MLGMTEDDVELDEGNAEEDEETADVIMLVELAVVAVEAVVNFGKPLLLMVINVIFFLIVNLLCFYRSVKVP